MELNRFISEHSRLTWSPGSVDCLLTLADWFVHRGFRDPAAHLRGIYDSEEGFREIIAAHGGAVQTVESCAVKIGLVRIGTPRRGSIAVIGATRDIHRQFGAIYDGSGRWFTRLEDRFAPMISKPLAVWDVT